MRVIAVRGVDLARWHSLTVDGAVSSHLPQVISITALVFVRLVLLYEGWTYRVRRRRVGGEQAAAS